MGRNTLPHRIDEPRQTESNESTRLKSSRLDAADVLTVLRKSYANHWLKGRKVSWVDHMSNFVATARSCDTRRRAVLRTMYVAILAFSVDQIACRYIVEGIGEMRERTSHVSSSQLRSEPFEQDQPN